MKGWKNRCTISRNENDAVPTKNRPVIPEIRNAPRTPS